MEYYLINRLIHFINSSYTDSLHYLRSIHIQTRSFQDATSPIIEELLHFHDHTLIIVFLISSLVLYIITLILTTKLTHTNTIDAQEMKSTAHLLLDNPNTNLLRRRTTLMSGTLLGPKDRRNPRAPKPNNSNISTTRFVLRTMFRDLWVTPITSGINIYTKHHGLPKFPSTLILNPTSIQLRVQRLYMIGLHDSFYSKNAPLWPPPLTTQSTRRSSHRRLHSPCSRTTKTRGLRHATNHINT
eukprot:bmy_14920T0